MPPKITDEHEDRPLSTAEAGEVFAAYQGSCAEALGLRKLCLCQLCIERSLQAIGVLGYLYGYLIHYSTKAGRPRKIALDAFNAGLQSSVTRIIDLESAAAGDPDLNFARALPPGPSKKH